MGPVMTETELEVVEVKATDNPTHPANWIELGDEPLTEATPERAYMPEPGATV